MDQNHVNQAEWEDGDHWSGPRWLCVYYSKKDTRTWVPKRIPGMGWTLNLGRAAGVAWLTGFLVGLPLVIILVMALGGS